jgi:cytochrome c oxidase subunit IV
MTSEDKKSPSECQYSGFFGGLIWWSKLIVAVLAVPWIGLIIAAVMRTQNSSLQLVAFVLTCWVCTFLGMSLMKNKQDKK